MFFDANFYEVGENMLKRNKKILDLELPRLKEKNKKNKNTKVVFKRLVFVLISILFVCTLHSLFTSSSENAFISGARKVLASVGVYTEEIKSVEIKSEGYDKQEGGSWHIDKSADWTDLNKAQIKFELNTVVKTGGNLKDVIFVLDISGSMSGDKLQRVKEDTKELISYLLSNKNNKVSLITFDTTSTILSGFSNDEDKLIELVDGLSTNGMTNYNDALLNVDEMLNEYEQKIDRDLVVLFLTDGYPCEDTPNQIATYKVLKDKYSYMTINGVQYEMGTGIIQDIIDISDNQFIANISNLSNVLFEASINPEFYESFEIVDYIDKEHWYIEDVKDIKVDKGHIKLEEENGVQKVIWSFESGEFRTGESANMTIDVSLKEQYVGTKGFYPTNEKETIEYKLQEEAEKDTSNKTPVLKSWYEVIYDANTPTSCKTPTPSSETHFMFESVLKQKEQLTCDGYIFKGWEIVTQGVKKINDDVFIMPTEDVIIRGIWTKPVIAKSMDGEVRERLTLYKKVKEDFNDSTKYVRKYTGATDTFLGEQDIYYYYGDAANNNVIFGNYCWKIVRTTDTGGVKLIYNGVPSKDGICNNGGDNSALTKEMMGKTSVTSAFNSNYSSPADVGYMYNTRYTYNMKNPSPTSSMAILNSSTMSSSTSYNYYYSDTYDYRSGRYYLYPTDNPDVAKQIPWIEKTTDEEGNTITKNNYEDLVGKYTCRSASTNKYCTTLYYVVKAEANRMYYIVLSNGNDLEASSKITLSKDVTKNDDGTYTLATPVEVNKFDWDKNYSNYKGYYICGSNGLTCSEMRYVSSSNNTSITYLDISKNYKYANSFTYDQNTKQYTLVDTEVSPIKETWNYSSVVNTFTNNHYTCWNTSGTCATISYIYYYYAYGERFYYINITDGKSVEDALNEMLYNEDVNTKDSKIKTAIDYWYEHNMMDYTEYLEDTYWCNDRSMNNQSTNGWNPNGGSLNIYIYFKSNGNSSNLTCSNKNDRFTVGSTNGNGALKYPVGLITRQEQSLALVSGKSPLASGNTYWSLSPNSFDYYANEYFVSGIGNFNPAHVGSSPPSSTSRVEYSYRVRPSVSLRATIEYTEGDGSADSPYIIDTSS